MTQDWDADLFVAQSERLFKEVWNSGLAEISRFFFGISSEVWKAVDRTKYPNVYQQFQVFIVSMRQAVFDRWSETVIQQFTNNKSVQKKKASKVKTD